MNEEWINMSFHPMDIAAFLALCGWVAVFWWLS